MYTKASVLSFDTLTSTSAHDVGPSCEEWLQAISPLLLLLAVRSLSFSIIHWVVTNVSRLFSKLFFQSLWQLQVARSDESSDGLSARTVPPKGGIFVEFLGSLKCVS